jgi:hypothetical protein
MEFVYVLIFLAGWIPICAGIVLALERIAAAFGYTAKPALGSVEERRSNG